MKKIIHILSCALFLIPLTVNASPKMYVASGNANDVVIIDLETDKIIGRIDELENAHGLAGNTNSEYLVAGSMKPLDSGQSSSPEKPSAVNEDEHKAHHAGGNGDQPTGTSYLSIIHPIHGHVMRRVAVRGLTHHTAVSPDGKIAIAVHSGNGGISVIDLDSMSVIETLDTGRLPNYAVFSDDGKHLYVSNAGDNNISEIDTGNWKVVRTLKAGKVPEHIVLGIHGYMLYSANKGDASVSAIDLKSGQIKQTYEVGNDPHGIDVSDDGSWLFVTSNKDNMITRIDLKHNELKQAELSPSPYHLAYIRKLDKLYVSSRKEPKIWVIDPAALSIKKVIELEKGVAHQMVIIDK